jgi:hypothetical protein
MVRIGQPDDDRGMHTTSGSTAGRKWAREKARPEELQRLARLAEQLQYSTNPSWAGWFSENPGQAFSAAERLYFVLRPDRDGDREAAATFWGPHEAEARDPDFVQGFAEGALAAPDERGGA